MYQSLGTGVCLSNLAFKIRNITIFQFVVTEQARYLYFRYTAAPGCIGISTTNAYFKHLPSKHKLDYKFLQLRL